MEQRGFNETRCYQTQYWDQNPGLCRFLQYPSFFTLCQVVARNLPKLIIIIVRAVQGTKADPLSWKEIPSLQSSPPHQSVLPSQRHSLGHQMNADILRKETENPAKRKSCHHHIHFKKLNARGKTCRSGGRK